MSGAEKSGALQSGALQSGAERKVAAGRRGVEALRARLPGRSRSRCGCECAQPEGGCCVAHNTADSARNEREGLTDTPPFKVGEGARVPATLKQDKQTRRGCMPLSLMAPWRRGAGKVARLELVLCDELLDLRHELIPDAFWGEKRGAEIDIRSDQRCRWSTYADDPDNAEKGWRWFAGFDRRQTMHK